MDTKKGKKNRRFNSKYVLYALRSHFIFDLPTMGYYDKVRKNSQTHCKHNKTK